MMLFSRLFLLLFLLMGSSKILQLGSFSSELDLNLINLANASTDLCTSEETCLAAPNYSTNGKYEFGIKHCKSMPCEIQFTQDYTYTPLVFVMPTIDAEEDDEDAPARLYIASKLSADSHSVTIDQQSLPDLSNKFEAIPMRSISYLIIEPGITFIDKHKVIAGYIETNKYQSKNGSTGYQAIPYSVFGGKPYDNDPVVLHQIQTQNNTSRWMTSGREADESNAHAEVRLFLELSASRVDDNYNPEKIAFLATTSSKKLETSDYYLQFKNDFETVQQSSDEPMEDGCEERFARTNLTRVDGVIAKKQERAGSHGGWLRTCERRGNQFSVVVDEDFSDRSHIPERVGYLAFERKKLKFDHCDFFPQPAQSWMPGSKVAFSNYKQKTPYPYFIGGWSDTYIQNNLNGGLLTIPFDSVSHSGSDPISCEAGRCSAGGYNSDITILDVSPAYPTSGVLNIDPSNYKAFCPTDGSGKYCRSSSDNKNIYITITSNLKSLSVAGSRAVKMHVNFTTDATEYGRVVGTYFVNQHVHTTFNNSGTYTFGEFITTGQTALTIGKKIVWKIGKVLYFANPVDLTSTEITDDFVIYAPDAIISFNKMSEDFYALILAKKIIMTNQMILHGAVTTNDLLIQNGKTTILGQSQCFNPPMDIVAKIEVKPFNYHLTCETSPQNIIEVHVLDKDGRPISGKIPTLREVDGNNLEITFISESNGVAKYEVIKKNQSEIGSYTLIASLSNVSSNTLTDTAQLHYVPYKFDIDNIKTISGKKTKFDIAVKACSTNNQLIDLGYQGTPSVSFSYVRPMTTPIASDLIVTADLNDNTRDAELTFMESGSITVVLEDKQFVCDEERCPIEGGSLKGEFTVDARPYKLAICDVKQIAKPNKKNPATTIGMPGFIPSGKEFSVTYRPIVHSDSRGTIALNDECRYPITKNYSLDNGELELSHKIAYPSLTNSTSGTLNPQSIPHFSSNSTLLSLIHTWDDVGTIALQSGANYLKMDLDIDTQNIGRFYPSYFALDQVDWIAPLNQGGVTYLSQPFERLEIGVAARNGLGEGVKNYSYFSSDLQAKFALKQDSKVKNKLEINQTGQWQQNRDGFSVWKLVDDKAAVMRLELADGKDDVITSRENGPFNLGGDTTDYGLTISGIDPVSFDAKVKVTEQIFNTQPPVQYGRMVLGNQGGVSGSKFTIPLRIEFWDGNRFVTNTLDDRATFTDDADHICKQTIWPASAADSGSKLVVTSGSKTVVDGASIGLEVWAADNIRREQVRFWMQLDDTSKLSHSSPHLSQILGCGDKGLAQPWLQYNWHGMGDEDPSTVVTFGVYRGNDKIIYRGEAGLTGQ